MPKIIYEPHPVTPERKTDLRAQGLKIVDARFAPEGYEHPDAKKKRGAKQDSKPAGNADQQEQAEPKHPEV